MVVPQWFVTMSTSQISELSRWATRPSSTARTRHGASQTWTPLRSDDKRFVLRFLQVLG